MRPDHLRKLGQNVSQWAPTCTSRPVPYSPRSSLLLRRLMPRHDILSTSGQVSGLMNLFSMDCPLWPDFIVSINGVVKVMALKTGESSLSHHLTRHWFRKTKGS